MNFEHIIFDCDGVLVDTEIVAAETMVPVLHMLGHSITIKHYLSKYTGKTFSDILDMFDIDDRVNQEMLIKNIEDKVYANIRPVKGIKKVVQASKLPMSVVSNSDLDRIRVALTVVNIIDKFDFLFSASMVNLPKPAPDVYHHATQKLGVLPERIIVVEDSVSGCTAAISAKMNVIGFCGGSHTLPTHEKELGRLGVKYIAKDARELTTLLRQFVTNELRFDH